jgi:hypothetical protein
VLLDGHQSWCPQIGQGKHRWAISAKVHPQPWNPVLDTLRPACGVRMMRASPCCEAISSSSCWLQAASVETGMGGSRTSSPNASSLPSVVDGRALKENTPEGDRRMCLKWGVLSWSRIYRHSKRRHMPCATTSVAAAQHFSEPPTQRLQRPRASHSRGSVGTARITLMHVWGKPPLKLSPCRGCD